MNNYALCVFVTAAILSVARIVGYKSGNIERLALGIICVYVILSPLRGLSADGLDSLLAPPDISIENGAEEVLEDAVAEGVASAVSAEFSLKKTDISVRLFGFDSENMRAEKIEIILSGSALTADYRSIESFVNKMEIGECRVEISFG